MKISRVKYIIGYCLIIVFLFNGVVPDAMVLSGQLTASLVKATLIEQEDVNTDRSTEETKGDPRTEYLPDIHSSFYIYPAQLFVISNNNIPRNTAFIQAVVIPVPTPPPDVTIA